MQLAALANIDHLAALACMGGRRHDPANRYITQHGKHGPRHQTQHLSALQNLGQIRP
jgi:hypothetical protein